MISFDVILLDFYVPESLIKEIGAYRGKAPINLYTDRQYYTNGRVSSFVWDFGWIAQWIIWNEIK